MLTQGGIAKAPQDHVLIRVVPGVPYGYILEQTTVFTNDVVCLVFHLPSLTEHALRPPILRPWDVARA